MAIRDWTGLAAYTGLWCAALWLVSAIDFTPLEGRAPAPALVLAALASCLATLGMNPAAAALLLARGQAPRKRSCPVVLGKHELTLLFRQDSLPHPAADDEIAGRPHSAALAVIAHRSGAGQAPDLAVFDSHMTGARQ